MDNDAVAQWEQTEQLPASERYEAWHHMLNRVYGTWEMEKQTGSVFDARMKSRAVGGFQVVECVCDPCGATRTKTKISKSGREAITIPLILSGRANITMGNKLVQLRAGDVLIWNSLRPLRFEILERMHKITVTVPLSRLRSWLPNSWHEIEGHLPHVSVGAGLMTPIVGSLSSAFLAGDLHNADALTESVIGLLVNVLNTDGSVEAGSLRGTHLLLVKRYIEENLAEPDLSPARIAKANRISLRYLHVLFEREGTTVQQYIIQERLLRCRRELENPSMAGRTITDIAFSWGFQSATHFSRRFKAAFGLTPQDYRAAMAEELCAIA